MKANTVNALSTVAISVGSFLLGGSFGISLASRNCEECYKNKFYDSFMERLNDDIESAMLTGDDKKHFSREHLEEIVGFTLKENHDKIFNFNDEESLTEYQRQVAQYSGDTDGDDISSGHRGMDLAREQELVDELLDIDEEDDDESYSNTIKEITVGDETIEVKQTEYGTEEVGEPYIVSKDSYEYEYEDFAKEDLVYFEDDGVLVDEKDEIIDNPDRYIGTEALKNFGEGSDDEDIVYVRNLRYSIDYRIVKEHTSYRENVLGLTEEGDKAAYEAALAFANTKEQNANIKKE